MTAPQALDDADVKSSMFSELRRTNGANMSEQLMKVYAVSLSGVNPVMKRFTKTL